MESGYPDQLYDRTSLGITSDGKVLVDNVRLHGILETSNIGVGTLWVQNINQPRRHGSSLEAYTRRWGTTVRMQYAGTLVAVDSSGRVVGKTTTVLSIPAGGFVLSDKKDSQISKLQTGDLVHLSWQVSPGSWKNVVHAVSGGPDLVRDGNVFVDFKDEKFRQAWTSAGIKARTAVGVTASHHLLMVTVEGRHTMYDLAKFLRGLGAVEAMNLDGGGLTTMVVAGHAVTHNSSKYERCVVSSLSIVAGNTSRQTQRQVQYKPAGSLSDFVAGGDLIVSSSDNTAAKLSGVPVSLLQMPQSEIKSMPDSGVIALTTEMPTQQVSVRHKKGNRFLHWVHFLAH